MKKITSVFFFLWALWGYSQVKSYTFSQSTGSYSLISGTVLGNTTSDNQYFVDVAVPLGSTATTGPGLPIGFGFTFNGQVYDTFGVNNNGWISLGTSSLTPAVNMASTSFSAPLSTVAAVANPIYSARIAALAADLQAQANSRLSYETSGTTGNKVLVIQWQNYKKVGANGTGDLFSFQIRLNQNSNTVQIVYGDFTSNDSFGALYQVGLRAEPTALMTNFSTRVSSNGWDNTTAGATATDRVLMTPTLKPPLGLTYTWTPPICGAAKTLVAGPVSTNSATLTWSSYTPVPADYEYVLSTSATLPSGSGTSTSGSTTVTIPNGLSPGTLYNFFTRSKCGSDFSAWTLTGSFKTRCLDDTVIYEDFEKYDTTILGLMPDCMDKTGTTGSMLLFTDGNTKVIQLVGNATPSVNTVAYAVLPPVSNLMAGTHRLRFKAYTSNSADPRTLDIGYLVDPNDVGTYQHLTTIDLAYSYAAIKEFIVIPGILTTGGKNLVFREKGTPIAATTALVDDVFWEPNPTCPNVTTLAAKAITQTSAKINWTAGGTETTWQYVYGLTSVTNPNTLTAVDVAGPAASATINGLSASTVYKVWVRSKCVHDLGAWIGPLLFETLCPAATEIHENFDAASTFPACWKKFETTGGTVSITAPPSPLPPSMPNALNLNGGSLAYYAMIALPPLSNTNAGTHRFRLKVRTTAVGGKLDIGWLTDASDPNTFNFIQSVAPTGITTYEYFVVTLGSAPQSPYLAFKNSGVPASAVLIDDVVWEPKPNCPDVSALKVDMVKSASADFSWVGGNETKWQYVVGAASVTDPGTLIPIEVSGTSNTTATNLDTSTSYKIWIRSKCSDTSLGAWIGPLVLATSCPPVTSFKENFDSAAALPSCWTKVGTLGTVAVGSTVTPVSTPNALSLTSTSSTIRSIVSMQPVSNAGEGTYQLKFKFRATVLGAKLEVGYLTNPADPASFISLKIYEANGSTVYDTVIADLGTDPLSEILAFRNYGISSTIYIDDVVWQPLGAIDPPVNDEPIGAISLTVGQEFGSNSAIETNVSATNSVQPTPGCGGFNGKDVWSKAVVPASGNITFEVNTMAGGITNTAAAAYSGSLSSLTMIKCDDSSSTAGDNQPKISLTGRTPGEVLYFRVWETGGDAFGQFLASAYDNTVNGVLGNDIFEANTFTYYPNPVRDMLNLSLNQEITNVAVLNLLGQQVINQSSNGNQVKVDMSNLSRGAYLVKIISGNQSKTIKVIKE